MTVGIGGAELARTDSESTRHGGEGLTILTSGCVGEWGGQVKAGQNKVLLAAAAAAGAAAVTLFRRKLPHLPAVMIVSCLSLAT